MTLPNMMPYDPNHKGEFCTRAGRKVHIWATDMNGPYPIHGYVVNEDGIKTPTSWTSTGKSIMIAGLGADMTDLMCVILKREREARVIEFDEYGSFISSHKDFQSFANVTFREVMPDDISQERAAALLEAAKVVVKSWREYDKAVTFSKRIDDLATHWEMIYE